MGTLDDLRIPNGVVAHLPAEIVDLVVADRRIARIADMRRTVHVAHAMDDQLDAGQPRRVVQLADAVFQHIGRLLDVVEAIGQILVGAGPAVAGHDLALGVDREGMGQLVHPVALRGIVAQVDEHLRFVIVEPRGVVDDRLAVEPLVQIGPGLFRKVLFGDTGHRRVAQTPPRKEILRRTQCCRQREQQNRSLHVCSFFGSSGICPVLNIYGSGGKKFSPRCYFLNVPINFFG